MSAVWIRNAVIVTARGESRGDLLLQNGRVAAVGRVEPPAGCEVVEAEGLIALPGLVDLHVHLRDFEQAYKDTVPAGARAAAAGGVTSLVAMANTRPTTDSPAMLRAFFEKAAGSPVRLYPAAAVTKGLQGREFTDFDALKAAGAIALSDDGMPLPTAAAMRRALEEARRVGLPLLSHSEDKSLTGDGLIHEGEISRLLGLPGVPAAAEEAATARELALAAATGAPVHICHVSTARAVDMIRLAKARGVPVTCETAPHYFTLTDHALLSKDAVFRMSPPLRTEADRLAVIAGLADGTIDAIATDHAPHAPQEKADFAAAPNGVLGLETALSLALTELVAPGYLTLPQLVEKTAAAPARILGLEAGDLVPGGPADLVLADTAREWTPAPGDLHSVARNCPYFGRRLRGRPVMTFCRGTRVFDLTAETALR